MATSPKSGESLLDGDTPLSAYKAFSGLSRSSDIALTNFTTIK